MEREIQRKKSFKELGPLEGWIDEMLENYSLGKDDVEVFSDMGISMRAVREFYDLSDTFAEAVDFGRQLSQSFWHKMARQGATGQSEVNSAMMKLNMGNRWGWSDKVSQDVRDKALEDNANLSVAELKTKFLKMLERNADDILTIEGEFTNVVSETVPALEHVKEVEGK